MRDRPLAEQLADLASFCRSDVLSMMLAGWWPVAIDPETDTYRIELYSEAEGAKPPKVA